MSVSLWRYTEACDGEYCVGDCDLCSKEPQEYEENRKNTRKKDKHGREILEGDIVKQQTAPECRYLGVPDFYVGLYKVEYDPELAAFMLAPIDGSKGKHHFLLSCEYEVMDQISWSEVF